MSDTDDCCIAIGLALALKKKNKSVCKKRVWMKKREVFSHLNLLNELILSSPHDFRNFLRMNEDLYNELLEMVTPKILKKDTPMRDAISVNQRLSITLRFLATGNTFADLKFISAISEQSIGIIVNETCEAIIEVLKDQIKVSKLNVIKGGFKIWIFESTIKTSGCFFLSFWMHWHLNVNVSIFRSGLSYR